MIHADDLCDIVATDGTGVVPVEQGLGALAAGDHVVTGTQQAIAVTVHADRTVVFVLRERHCNDKSQDAFSGEDNPHSM